jgi:hypothetical protein
MDSPVQVQLGAENVVLRLTKSGSLKGALLLDDRVEPRLFQVRAFWSHVDALGSELRRNSSAQVEAGGAFEIANVAPGLVDVEITLAATGQPLELVSGVLVTGGEVTHDPQLDPIDLTDDVFAYRIEVADDEGRPVTNGYVATEGPSNQSRMAYAIRNGAAIVLAFERFVDLEVSSPGHTTLLLTGVDGDRQVMLDPALSVRLRLADDVCLPRSPVVLQAKLIPAAGGNRPQPDAFQVFDGNKSVGWASPWTMGIENTFGPSREISALVTQPGRQMLHFMLTTRGSGSESSRNVPAAPEIRIELGQDDAGKVFTVAPIAEQYERALRELDG